MSRSAAAVMIDDRSAPDDQVEHLGHRGTLSAAGGPVLACRHLAAYLLAARYSRMGGLRSPDRHNRHDASQDSAAARPRRRARRAASDAEKLLQGIVTNDMDLLASAACRARRAADAPGQDPVRFFVVRQRRRLSARDGARPGRRPRQAAHHVQAARQGRHRATPAPSIACWRCGDAAPHSPASTPRSCLIPRSAAARARHAHAWRQARIAHGRCTAARPTRPQPTITPTASRSACPRAARTTRFGDTFPHEANLDLLNGVSFSKGCFVGQEVVSRMQHRGTARKRIVIVEATAPLQTGSRDHGGRGDHRHDRLGGRHARAGAASASTGRRRRSARASRSPLAGAALAVRLPAYMTAGGRRPAAP